MSKVNIPYQKPINLPFTLRSHMGLKIAPFISSQMYNIKADVLTSELARIARCLYLCAYCRYVRI